jgi:hypothetical protein
MKMRRRLMVAVLTLSALTLGCVGTAFLMLASRPPALYNHRDTIAYTLARHEIRFAAITFEQSFEERQNFDNFSASVQVTLRDGRVAHGWIGCEDGDNQCFLELRSIGIRGVRLPSLTQRPQWPWLAHIERGLRQFDWRVP